MNDQEYQEQQATSVSARAIENYPPDGIYRGDFADDPSEWRVCTCTDECGPCCKGECGCKACSRAYQDFLSME